MEKEKDETVEVELEPPELGVQAMPPEIQALVQRREGFDKERMLQEWEYRKQVGAAIIPVALNKLNPSDFIFHGSGDDAVAYLQGKGADRLKPELGLIIPTEPKAERVDLGEGFFAYIVTGWAGSRSTGSADYVVGGRSSKDAFFTKLDDDGNRKPVDELDVLKAAHTNWRCRAISGLCGIQGMTRADLKRYGFDVAKCKTVEYQSGSAGGGGATVVPKFADKFKEFWGKKWEEVSKEALIFYLKDAQDCVGDQGRKKWHSLSRRRITAINAEIERRRSVAPKE